MANDYVKKEPTKTERMLYDLAVYQQQMEKGLWSTSTVVMALALLTKTKPEELAELIANGDDKIKEFSQKVNDIIKSLDAKKQEGHEHNQDGSEKTKVTSEPKES